MKKLNKKKGKKKKKGQNIYIEVKRE